MVVATATAPGAATGTLASLTSGVAGLGVADPPATPPRPRGYDDEPGAVGNVLSTKVALALSPSEDPPPRSGFPYVIPLKELCLESVARAFASDQSCLREGVLPESLRARVVDLLDVRLDINLAGRWIADEAYWCRRARARWPSLARPGFAPTARGRSWKQMYFEKHVEEAIVASANDEAGHGPGPGDEDDDRDDEKKRNEKENHLDATVRLAKKWTRVLSLRGLRAGGGSVRLGPTLFEPLAGCLTSLTLQYGAKGAGVGYEPSAFGMAEADCEALARCLPSAETLVRLSLPENGLDCRRARIIAAGLGDNVSVTVLDLRSNAIGCRGARAIAKLLDARSVLRELDLGDNDVGEEGARALARALRKNISMRTLSLRLNAFVGDAGGEALCDAIRKASVAGTTRLESIDLGACGLGPRAARAAARMLRCENSVLVSASFAGNDDFGPEAGGAFRAAFRGQFAKADAGDGSDPSTADPDAFRSSSGSGAGPASSSYDRSVSKPFGTSAKVPAFPSVRSLEVRGCGFGEECEEALEAAVRANRARREASAVEFPDRVSGIVTNATFFENLREESHE